MNRSLTRWVVVGDVVQAGAEDKHELEAAIFALCTEFELDQWVLSESPPEATHLVRAQITMCVEWTNICSSPEWAVRVVHGGFMTGRYQVDPFCNPIRLFGYRRPDGRYAVIAAISHLFADGVGLKGFARALEIRLASRSLLPPVIPLSEVLAVQQACKRTRTVELDRFSDYARVLDWDSLNVREVGELVLRKRIGRAASHRNLAHAGTVLAALGIAWRHSIQVADYLDVPMAVLHRHPSPVPGRTYMGPGDLTVMLNAPIESDAIKAPADQLLRTLIRQTRESTTTPPFDSGSSEWAHEQDSLSRTLRLNVRSNPSELARGIGPARFEVDTTRGFEGKRAFADVLLGEDGLRIRWDLPRASAIASPAESFGQLAVSALQALGGQGRW